MAARKPKSKKKSSSQPPNNGLSTYCLHALDKAAAPTLAKLAKERSAHPAFGLAAAAPAGLDPESVAQRYLQQALQSDAVPALTAPASDDAESEFKSIGTETIPLT